MGFHITLRRLALTLPLIAAMGLAVSAPSSAASGGDSLTFTNANFNFPSGAIVNGTATSAADTPIPATGTLTFSFPSNPSDTFTVSCLNVVDPHHAYVGAFDSDFSFVALVTTNPSTFTEFVLVPPSDCAQPSSLSSAGVAGLFTLTGGSVQIVDASPQNAQGQNNNHQGQNQT
ncbi:MAG TPA: hypothetical protein VFZ97_13100 [Acidimicrobiales bacterium]